MTEATQGAGVALDLDDVVERDSAELELKHPQTGAPSGIVFVLAGPEHEARRDIRFAQQRDMRKRMAKMKGASLGKFLADSDPEDEEAKITDYLVASTLGWRDLYIKGQPVPFTRDAARAIYVDPKRAWVRRQVQEFLEDAENFLATSPTR